jgi:hypothetical protein
MGGFDKTSNVVDIGEGKAAMGGSRGELVELLNNWGAGKGEQKR